MSCGHFLFLLAAVVTVSAGTEDNLFSIGLRIGATLATSAENSTTVGGNCFKPYECASCTEARLCAPTEEGGDFREILRTKCRAPKHFCDYSTGSCSAEMNPVCVKHGEFTCVRDGVFPHPRSCNQLYHCENLLSTTYICNQGTYDPRSQECGEHHSCYKFNCYDKTGFKVPHPVAREYFAYCSDGKAIVVDRCSESDLFIEEAQKCMKIIQTAQIV